MPLKNVIAALKAALAQKIHVNVLQKDAIATSTILDSDDQYFLW